MAASGLASNFAPFIVGAMLVSPTMGPVLGMIFGYRIADWHLFKKGFVNEMKMAIGAFCVGCLYALFLGYIGKTYSWPNDSMMQRGQGYNMLISVVGAMAAGMVLAVALTSTGGNALVGTALSAGLLPPLVSSGMLFTYGGIYAPLDTKQSFYEMASYSLCFYTIHVVTVIVTANFVFWLKDVDSRFKEGEDADFSDISSLQEHRARLEEKGLSNDEVGKAKLFLEHIKTDVTDFATNFASAFRGTPAAHRSRDGESDPPPGRTAYNPLFGDDGADPSDRGVQLRVRAPASAVGDEDEDRVRVTATSYRDTTPRERPAQYMFEDEDDEFV